MKKVGRYWISNLKTVELNWLSYDASMLVEVGGGRIGKAVHMGGWPTSRVGTWVRKGPYNTN